MTNERGKEMLRLIGEYLDVKDAERAVNDGRVDEAPQRSVDDIAADFEATVISLVDDE